MRRMGYAVVVVSIRLFSIPLFRWARFVFFVKLFEPFVLAPSSQVSSWRGENVIRDTENLLSKPTTPEKDKKKVGGWLFVGRPAPVIDSMLLCLRDSSHTRRRKGRAEYRFIFFLFGEVHAGPEPSQTRQQSGLWLPPPCIIVDYCHASFPSR